MLVLAGCWVFSPAFQGDWLWDDQGEIIQNPLLPDPAGLWKIWFAPVGPDYFPLKSSLQWVQWHLWQGHPLGYHLTNTALHLLSALLLWHLLKKLGLRFGWLGGLLFAFHPVAVESVAWISELKNTLSLPLLLLAMCAWLDYDSSGRRTAHLRAWLLFLAAMLCKSSVVMFPVLLLLHAWWKRGRIAAKDLLGSAPFFAVSLVLGLVTVWFQSHRAIGPEAIATGGFFTRMAGAGRVLVFYCLHCVWPVGLLPVYPRWPAASASPGIFISWLLLGAGLYGLWRRRATWGRPVLFGCGCFLINLVPVLGFIPMSYQRITSVADHLAYLPLVGLAGLAAAGAGLAQERLQSLLRRPALAMAALVVVLFALQSHRYAAIFRNAEALWSHTVQRNPKAWLAQNNLGLALAQNGRAPEAMLHYEETLRLNPDFAEAHFNLAEVLVQRQQVAEAISHYEEALRLRPDYAPAHNNLGLALIQTGRLADAITHYEEALRLQPDTAEAFHVHYNLANALLQAGQVEEAIGHYEAALRLQPDYAEAHNNLGNVLVQSGRPAEAMKHFEEGLRLQPDSIRAYYNLGNVLAQLGRLPEAVERYRQALRIKADYPPAHINLGNALMQMGQATEAIGHYEEALRLQPDFAGGYYTHYNLGNALLRENRMPEAVAHYEEALRLKPDFAPARSALERLKTMPGAPGPAPR